MFRPRDSRGADLERDGPRQREGEERRVRRPGQVRPGTRRDIEREGDESCSARLDEGRAR